MRRRLGIWVAAAIVAVPAPAAACGAMVSDEGVTELSEAEALLAHDGTREELIVTVGYDGGQTRSGFAWLMPLPSPPDVEEADADALHTAGRITEPPKRADHVPSSVPLVCACGAGSPEGDAGAGPLDRTVVRDLEFATLEGSSAAAVGRWLDRHGFDFHDRQRPTVQRYLDRGWVVVAARVLPGAEPSGDIVPVRFAFESGDPVYPLAIAGSSHTGLSLPMSLWVVTSGPVRAETMTETVVQPNDDGELPPARDRLELSYAAPLADVQAELLSPAISPPSDAWLSFYRARWSSPSLEDDLVFASSGDDRIVNHDALLQLYGRDRGWAVAGQMMFAMLLVAVATSPLAAVLLLGALIARAVRRRAQ